MTRLHTSSLIALIVGFSGCGDSGGSLSAQQRMQAVTSVQIVSVAAALAIPMRKDADQLHVDRAIADQTEVHTRIQHGFSGTSVVTPPTCAMFNWNGLSVTITLNGCTLEQTGQTISGTVTLAVMLNPTQLAMTLANLTIGGQTYTGQVTLSVGGADLAPTFTIGVDLASGTSHFTGTLTIAMGAFTVSGSGMVALGTTTTAVTISGVTFTQGKCLPSAGTVTLAGPPMVTITFLATTPTDGKVQVQVGGAPSSTQMLFTPC